MAAGAISPSEHPEETPHATPKQFQTRLKAVAEVVGLVAAILGIVFAIHDALQEPQIRAQTAQTSTPFSLYFSLHNSSFVFGMNDMRIECVLMEVRSDRYYRFKDFPLSIFAIANTRNVSIPPGQTVQYNCPLDKVFTGLGQIVTAEIQLKAKFRTLNIERNAHEMFNWNNVSRQWTQGKIIN